MPYTASGDFGLGMPKGLEGLGTPEVITNFRVQHFTGPGPEVLTEFKFNAMPMTLFDLTPIAQGNALKLFTFPRGQIIPYHVSSHIAFTTTPGPLGTNTIINSLNSGVVINYGFGTAPMTSTEVGVPLTTMINFLPGTGVAVTTAASSTVINTEAATVFALKSSATLPLNGATTPLPLWLNVGIPTAGDIDADSTVTIRGRLLIRWANEGGFDYYTRGTVVNGADTGTP